MVILANNRIIGKKYEDVASDYLSCRGYEILERNYSSRSGEIDIIARDGDYIVFVEVKARKDEKFGTPREAVNWHKQQTIVKCAKSWLFRNKRTGVPVRFDVVEILDAEITHIVDAFRP